MAFELIFISYNAAWPIHYIIVGLKHKGKKKPQKTEFFGQVNLPFSNFNRNIIYYTKT